jgi:hypothetical protein
MAPNAPLLTKPGSRSTDDNRLAPILAALWQTPIPTAPPPHDSYQEALGLNLLTLALHLEHIERISETLTLADSTHMARSVTVEITMNALTADQKRALRSDPTSRSDPESNSEPATIWIPLARQVRSDMAPVVVRNAAGEVVNRATQVKTADALIHGMSKAFRMLLASDARTEDPHELLYGIRHHLNQSRWLIEATIANMIDSGRRYPEPEPEHSAGRLATDSDSIRVKATAAIKDLFTGNSPFLQLLKIASSDNLLVVEVPTNKPRTFLRYDAPTMPVQRDQKTVPPWASLQQEFTVRYFTVIPRAVNSYHVTIEVPPEIQVRRFFLTSNVDKPAVDSLVEDMRVVANNYDQLRGLPNKLLELELQSIASRLAEFGRRRYRDLESFTSYIVRCYAKLSRWNKPPFPAGQAADKPVALDGLLWPERPIVSWLAHFSDQYEADQFRHLTDDGLLPPVILNWLADELVRAELYADIYVDNDPRENAGHAQWQRRPFGTDPQPEEQVDAAVYIALVDDPPSLASNVSKLLLAVVLMVVGFGAVLEPQLFTNVPLLGELGTRLHPNSEHDVPMSSADAIVTMLLLVPGIMLSRLDIPSTKTVLGQLRLLPRYVAYASVITAGGLALLVASVRSDELEVPIMIAMYALLVQALLMGVDAITKARKRRALVPMSEVSPAWLVAEIRPEEDGRRTKWSAAFSTVDPSDHD